MKRHLSQLAILCHLAAFLSTASHAAPKSSSHAAPTSTIDAVSPGDTLSYGIHQLKWLADKNGNQLMDLGEVETLKNGSWQTLDKDAFTQTIKRRRAALHMKNGYVYKKTPTRDLSLYIDFPENWQASDKRPAIVWFFGGAWNTGTPYAFKPKADYFAKRGVVGIRVDYRIRTVDGIGADGFISGHDAKTALRWVRKNAAELGIDPDNIIAGGDSAGGHLAIATQIPTLNDPTDDTSISTMVSALLLHNPYVVLINPESWIYQIDFKTLPPVWVSYGLKDKAAYNDDPSSKRAEKNGESFVKELKLAGIPLKTYIKEDAGHGFCSGPPHIAPSTLDLDLFLQQCRLLEKGSAPLPSISGGAMLNALLSNIEAGRLPQTKAKTLSYVTQKEAK